MPDRRDGSIGGLPILIGVKRMHSDST